MTSAHFYAAFGLTFRSGFAIPALPVATAGRAADVEIVAGRVEMPADAVEISDMHAVAGPDGFYLWVPEAGTFLIRGGRHITIMPDPGATVEQVQSYLLGSVMGALLHQRGMLPLHCNAIKVGDAAILMCGDSGAGKSTLAAFFQRRGFLLLTDDICAVQGSAAAGFTAWPGIPRLKLWRQSLDAFDMSTDGLSTVPWEDDKFELRLRTYATEPLRVGAVYYLREAEDGRDAGIFRLSGLGALNALTANIYRRRLADVMGAGGSYLGAVAQMVSAVPVLSMTRNWGLDNFEAEALACQTHMCSLIDGQLDDMLFPIGHVHPL